MKELIVATRNPHKKREIRALFGHSKRWRLIFLDRYPRLPLPKETGKTFDENALLKARAIARYTGKPAIADDSGLEVFALRGRPGVRSARFAGSKATDEENNQKLLRLLNTFPPARRKARYQCSLAFVRPGHKPVLFRGKLSGWIGFVPKGRHGFGYDPLFFLPRYGKSVAQLSPTLKNHISHRSRAFQKFKRYLKRRSRRRPPVSPRMS